MYKEFYFKVANIVLRIAGTNTMPNALAKHFHGCACEKTSKVDLDIVFLNDIKESKFKPKYYSLSGSLAFNERAFSKRQRDFIYVVYDLFSKNEKCVLEIVNLDYSRIKKIAYLILGDKRESRMCNLYMNYGLFWMIFPIILQKKNMAFVHSGIGSIEDKAIAMCGTGGCGKTSTLFTLLENDNSKFMSEDFGIISSDGYAYFNPKRATIYESDVRYGQKDLIQFKKSLYGRDRIRWMISSKLGQNPRRKVDPEILFGKERITDKAVIGKVTYLMRGEFKEVETIECDKVEIAQRITDASYRELKELYEILSNVHAVGSRKLGYPTIEELKEEHTKIVLEAIKNANVVLCKVPIKAVPLQILDAILLMNYQ